MEEGREMGREEKEGKEEGNGRMKGQRRGRVGRQNWSEENFFLP